MKLIANDYGTYQNNDNFEIWAIGKDKVIKAISTKNLKFLELCGIQRGFHLTGILI